MSLRTAVVGGGTISDNHLDGLDSMPLTTLAAFCDVDEDRVREVAAEYGIPGYTDMETMLAEADLDWVHLCTPVGTHLELATAAIEAGVPVLIQKPITETVAEYEQLAETAREHGVHVAAVHNHDFDPAMRELTTALNHGAVGEVRTVEVTYTGQTYPDSVRRGDWAFELPGGEFEEGLPHPLYMLLRTGGYPTDREDVQVITHLRGEYDRPFTYDGAKLQYKSREDVLCSATLTPGNVPDKHVTVHGEDGVLIADLISQTLVTLDRDYQASPIARARNNLDRAVDRIAGNVKNVKSVVEQRRNDDWATRTEMDAHAYQFEAEALALTGDREPPVPLEEAGWTIRLMEAIRDAADAEVEVAQDVSATD
ncbi:Gfo/Idh/MocA family protein [Halorientalis halophila]|uniref:Gfo/Idh/MocA family protein n=1 Tax=Halorientalis halophila TaxID=3108499 RepID=UPI003009461B